MQVSNKKRIVGTFSFNYSEKRMFAGLTLKGFEFKKIKDFVRIFAHIYWRIKKKPHPYFTNLFWDFGLNNYQILHFFNAVNMGNQPWITTFERYIPRDAHHPGVVPKENWYINYTLKRAAHPSCKKLIAISDYAYRSQVRYLKAFGRYQDEILAKTIILHPGQKLMITSLAEKKCDPNVITFTIVGADFFRKGGKEILNVFDRLLAENKAVALNVISSLDYGDYASLSTKEDQLKALAIIEKNERIKHFKYIPNAQVLEILKATDISLLPTYDDTYGYFVLESQAFGCPVISTNGGVLPEINNNEIGWVIEVPLFEDGRSIPREKEQKKIFTTIVEESLYRYINEVIDNPSLIKIKGEKALKRISVEHNLDSFAQKIEEIYNNALSKTQ